jgi:hypothetical protein
VLDIESEQKYISKKRYTKYQIQVSATILAIITLYPTYKVTIQYMWCILERRVFPVEARFSAPVETGPEAHPTSCTMGNKSFPGVESGRGVTLTPEPLSSAEV